MIDSALLLEMRLLLCVLFVASFLSGYGHELAPSLLWASASVYGTNAEPTVHYQTLGFLDLWKATLDAFVNHSGESNAYLPTPTKDPEIFVVFVSDQLEPWQLSGDTSTSAPLRAAFASSASKYVFNDVRLERGQVMDFIPASLQAAGADVTYLGSCPEADGATDFATVLKATQKSTPKVVVMCGEGDLSQEMAQLQEMDAALKASNLEYVMLFVSEFEDHMSFINAPQRRRSLKADDEDVKQPILYDRCDDLCRVRVKFLEGIILSIILSLALTAGLCCMHILDSPSQFEKPDDTET